MNEYNDLIKKILEKRFALHDVDNIVKFLNEYSKYYNDLEHYSENDFDNFLELRGL